jgi:hypothetical protein
MTKAKVRFIEKDQETLVTRATMSEILKQCLDHGMGFPFIVCAVSPNGNVFARRLPGPEPGGDQQLTDHTEDDTFDFPIQIMILDTAGSAAWVTLTRNKGEPVILH